jgi:hypothetical protein
MVRIGFVQRLPASVQRRGRCAALREYSSVLTVKAAVLVVALDERVDLVVGGAALEPRCTPRARSEATQTVRESSRALVAGRGCGGRAATCPRVDEICDRIRS